MSTAGRVLVVQHEDKAPPGLVLTALEQAGLTGDVLAAHEGRALPAALADHRALIVLGGSMNATEDADHRWLLPTKALIAGTVAAGRPFLGICLGHQLATVALGGLVGPHPLGPARGLLPWGPTPEGQADPFTGVLGAGSPVLHWNGDVALTLPPGAQVLAAAPDGTMQAARFGPLAWGLQFHPEVDADLVQGWLGDPGRDVAHQGVRIGGTASGDSVEDVEQAALTDLRERQDGLLPVWHELLVHFGRLSLTAGSP